MAQSFLATTAFTVPVIAIFWFAMMAARAGVALYLGARLRDRTYGFLGGYVGAISVMSLITHVLGARLQERLGDGFIYLNNLMHLPYALFYLGFVAGYFGGRARSPGWMRFQRVLMSSYAIALAWLAFDAVTGANGSAWAILGCNLINLVSSMVLAAGAARDHRPGAREFLLASVPLLLSGLVLIAQFLDGTADAGGPTLLAFRTGFLLHVMILLIALSVRDREQRARLG
ncbi:MAG: hypothetical protein IT582_04130 [Opitutaceae bacterium]|nr:hypothetical protein [Opitutaceae bacterium]